ncbi:hypothetical protein GCM10018772_33590 [Streptomyces fumanus]|uniref:Uncharacterized protein n=1 Tax=Streptomyces fumanus TaxID=67302 RepID=A0A919AIH8_9ACTN|nr:hypothetical protein GCM10018772_33590 [Streptomyces fumanus]
MLGEGDLLAAELGQGEVGDLEVLPVVDSRHYELLLGLGRGWVRLTCAAADTGVPKEDTGMPAYAQRSPSEALSPSAGPCPGRPTAISSDVWLRPKLHRWAPPTPVGSRRLPADHEG